MPGFYEFSIQNLLVVVWSVDLVLALFGVFSILGRKIISNKNVRVLAPFRLLAEEDGLLHMTVVFQLLFCF